MLWYLRTSSKKKTLSEIQVLEMRIKKYKETIKQLEQRTMEQEKTIKKATQSLEQLRVYFQRQTLPNFMTGLLLFPKPMGVGNSAFLFRYQNATSVNFPFTDCSKKGISR
tara:strand:+ start:366 stop:695 length:330 start_codon:yes stop_codon:yes gene_type:complete